ncbi:hypothetical protein MCOL2_08871 [Listeria fleischmannii FSL S10-1203]|uniref:Fibronectin type-III domain-containing protein n=1 Tax=Listeria fleischmannii FSL S10-1203 TaxID=1265822 RepID=W7DT44_9LIST|nr:hypothetical protein MCOL2_08871 [Listeria fleischmannii FSL S10-1203]
MKEFTATSITFAWEPVELARYYVFKVNGVISNVSTNEITVNNLTPKTKYTASVFAFSGFLNGEKSEVTQKTRMKMPTVGEYRYGETYILLDTDDDPNVMRAPISDVDGNYIATGSVTNGKGKIYVLGNAKIIAGHDYLVTVTDETDPNNKVASMPARITAKIASLSVHDVTVSDKVVSGVTDPNGQVRISQNGTAKTVVTADATTGAFTFTLSSCVVGDVILVETKVGSIYPSSKTVTVRDTSGSITVNNYTLNTSYVTGTYTGDVVNIALEVNSVLATKIKVLSETTYQYYSKGVITSEMDSAYIIAYDSANKQLDKKKITINKA